MYTFWHISASEPQKNSLGTESAESEQLTGDTSTNIYSSGSKFRIRAELVYKVDHKMGRIYPEPKPSEM